MKQFILSALLLLAGASLVSCSSDEPAEKSTGIETEFGEIMSTGKRTAEIYFEEENGPTALSIPGFPDITAGTSDYGECYGFWVYIKSGASFTNVSSYNKPISFYPYKDEEGWTIQPNKWYQSNMVSNNGYLDKRECNFYVRIEASTLEDSKYATYIINDYVFAKFWVEETIKSNKKEYNEVPGDNVIGLKVCYESPVIPLIVE